MTTAIQQLRRDRPTAAAISSARPLRRRNARSLSSITLLRSSHGRGCKRSVKASPQSLRAAPFQRALGRCSQHQGGGPHCGPRLSVALAYGANAESKGGRAAGDDPTVHWFEVGG